MREADAADRGSHFSTLFGKIDNLIKLEKELPYFELCFCQVKG